MDCYKNNFSNYMSLLHSRHRSRGAAGTVKSAMLLQRSEIPLSVIMTMTAISAQMRTGPAMRTMGCRPCGVGKMGKMDMASGKAIEK